MKLELKHLCGYLPYDLEGIIVNDGIIRKVVGFNYFSLNLKPAKFRYTHCYFDNFKPILHPLSDLTKPLPDGTIAILELAKIAFPFENWYLKNENVCSAHSDVAPILKFKFRPDGFVIETDNFHGNFAPNQFECFQYLFSKHFDIYGLIEKGLAIDINTLK